jgi:hypothetical protein
MQARFHSAELLLHKGQTFELGEAAWSVVTGICGTVWLTRDGDLADNLLGPGQSLALGSDGRAWLSALGEARVRVEQKGPAPRGLADRLARRLRASYLRFARATWRGRIVTRDGAAPAH